MRNAIAALERLRERVEKGSEVLAQRLAEAGAEKARDGFAGVDHYAGDPTVDVYTEAEGKTASVVASGQAVAFLEFGAGVHYYTGYPGDRPAEIHDIGTYGDGKGASGKGWIYAGEQGLSGHPVVRHRKSGDVVREGLYWTRGNKPYAPMFRASQEIQDSETVEQAVKEAFT